MMIVYRFIAPAQEVEFDKAGRLSIPQSLREYANLEKDCTVLGVANHVEIWDSNAYKQYLEACEEAFNAAAEEFNDITL